METSAGLGGFTTDYSPKRRERKKRECRENLIKAAHALFKEKGFANTSIEEIAESADVSKGTFFNYFPGKENVLAAIAEEELARLNRFIAADLKDVQSVREKICRVLVFLTADTLSFSSRITQTVNTGVLKEGARFLPFAGLKDTFVDLVTQAQAKNEINIQLDPDEVALMLIGSFFSLLLQEAEYPAAELPYRIQAHFALLCKGIAAV